MHLQSSLNDRSLTRCKRIRGHSGLASRKQHFETPAGVSPRILLQLGPEGTPRAARQPVAFPSRNRVPGALWARRGVERSRVISASEA